MVDVYQSFDHDELTEGIVPLGDPEPAHREPEVFQSSDHDELAAEGKTRRTLSAETKPAHKAEKKVVTAPDDEA